MHKHIWIGIGSANVMALLLMILSKLMLEQKTDAAGVVVLSEFVVVPMLMGIINAFTWKKHKVSIWKAFGIGFLNFIVSLILGYFMMGEGYICLLIISPLLYLFLMLGIALGRWMFKVSRNKLNASVLLGLIALFLANTATAAPVHRQVTDRLLIHAPVEVVWSHVVAFPPIDSEPTYWLFRIGLPAPVQSTAEGYYQGADRKCIFENGIVFDEKIVEFVPEGKLTFQITKQPDNPEIMHHLTLQKGQFVLQDNGDGTTTLIGSSWYELKVKPAQYFDLWADSIVRHVHMRVMEHIQSLSEEDKASPA